MPEKEISSCLKGKAETISKPVAGEATAPPAGEHGGWRGSAGGMLVEIRPILVLSAQASWQQAPHVSYCSYYAYL